MVDVLTLEQRSYNMSRIRGKNTAPEMAVGRLLRSLGYAGLARWMHSRPFGLFYIKTLPITPQIFAKYLGPIGP